MDLHTNLNSLVLDNPIIPASGSFGFGYEFADLYDINILGSISLKGTTLKKNFGNLTPRIAETHGGLLNAVGLQNPGIDQAINEELPRLKKVYKKLAFANICGSTIDEYIEIAKKFDQSEMISILEINVSCPSTKAGGIDFGSDLAMLKELISALKKETTKPLFVKLSPNVTNIVDFARCAQNAGADGLVLINSLSAMRIDIERAKPAIANTFGGLSGGAIFPIALRMVFQVYDAVNIPIIGVGGITCVDDVIEMIMAGAAAVQIGTENLINPFICQEIIEKLPQRLEQLGYSSIRELIGRAHG